MKIGFDPSKDRISLSEVEAIFYAVFALAEEDRFVTQGTDALGCLLVVVYCYWGEDEIRVFSARHAPA